ncbi:hypothetical protein CRG98_030806 [Punica granatum]|uniref:Uncharacterized protein n=1 Tax=Punica granatum TaxID=22663 RepID=A0A2I0IXT5_PUNGR|nr:hypothetical protein CRG98_030806 [Punica granatum]
MLGWSPKVVNAGPKPDAGPKPNARPKPIVVNACSIRKCKRCKSKDAWGHVEICASDHAVTLSVRKKLLLVSLALESGSTLGPQLALPWRKGEGRRWPTREGWHDPPVMRGEDRGWSTREGQYNSPVVRGGWLGWTASGHSTSRHGEVKTAGSLPAKVGTTRLSCGTW